jgi:UDP-glucose 4-epimerase
MKGKNILITGGAGFIGSHLAALLEQCNRVTVLDDLSNGFRHNLKGLNLRFVEGSITNKALVARLCKGQEFVFHLAAMTSVQESIENPGKCYAVNIRGSFNVLEACRRAKTRKLLFASSAAVYGDAPGLPKKEHMHTLPLSPYAVSKAAVEQQAIMMHRLHSLDFACLRLFNVYGPRQDPSSAYSGVISRFLAAAAAAGPVTIFGDGQQTRDFVYVEDVAKAFLKAALAPASGIFNIACNSMVSIKELLGFIMHISGRDSNPVFMPERPGDIRHSYADISKARGLLSWTPEVKLLEGLRATLDSLKKPPQ